MLIAALEEPDPVFIFEHALLYPMADEIDEEPQAVDIAHAAVRREGSDVTLVTYGGSLGKCLAAAATLEEEHGLAAEVVDLRTLRPLDTETILASLAKTHRMVIVDEGWKTGGLAGEISAQVMEQGFDLLDWPVQRVCGVEVPMPYAKHLEEAALPSAERVVAAVTEMAF
jgi:pyruvate/2-oxoglutarate/acetoin dehydrogenase E1 component